MAKDKEQKMMRLRFRKPVTLPGPDGEPVQHMPTSADVCPCSDEAWDAVNRGDADLEPPPGESMGDFTQPRPEEIPERLRRASHTEAALPAVPVVPTGAVVTMTPKEAEKAREAAAAPPPAEEDTSRRHGRNK